MSRCSQVLTGALGILLLIPVVAHGSKPMGTTAQPAVPAFNGQELERAVNRMFEMYNLGPVSGNPDGKPPAQWTASDFNKFDKEDLHILRAIIIDERYDLLDRVKPTAMSRAEFVRAIMRSAAERGLAGEFYDWRFRGLPADDVTVARPLGAPPQAQRTVSASPVVLALNDAASNVVRNPTTGGIYIEPDVAQQIGLPVTSGNLSGISMATDSAAFDLGYTIGSMPQFRVGTALQKALPFASAPEVVQSGFCPAINSIFKSGNALDRSQAFIIGMVQARIDARSNFHGLDLSTGIIAPCPSATPPVTAEDLKALAINKN